MLKQRSHNKRFKVAKEIRETDGWQKSKEWTKVSPDTPKRMPWEGLSPQDAYYKGLEDGRREKHFHDKIICG